MNMGMHCYMTSKLKEQWEEANKEKVAKYKSDKDKYLAFLYLLKQQIEDFLERENYVFKMEEDKSESDSDSDTEECKECKEKEDDRISLSLELLNLASDTLQGRFGKK